MKIEKTRILIAAGGTGGHVYPAIAVADEIKKAKAGTEIMFAGTKEKIEARVVPQKGYAISYIWISGLHRSLRIGNLLFPVKVVVSLFQSYLLLRKFNPDAVVGTGGYVCGPVLYMASILGYTVIVHESNSLPGITTRLLSHRATRVFTAFDATADHLKRKDNIECVGTPTRDALGKISRTDGARFFNLDPSKKTIFIFGGSLGATSINKAADNFLLRLTNEGIQVIWQTGSTDIMLVEKWKSAANCWIGAFIDSIEYAYAAADLIICRAGATTLAELTRIGKASILVPYPYAAADHQTFNARTLENSGAAVVVSDKDVQTKLENELMRILGDDVQREKMNEASRKLGKPDAGEEIARKILKLAEK